MNKTIILVVIEIESNVILRIEMIQLGCNGSVVTVLTYLAQSIEKRWS